jgi:hypothetical protein
MWRGSLKAAWQQCPPTSRTKVNPSRGGRSPSSRSPAPSAAGPPRIRTRTPIFLRTRERQYGQHPALPGQRNVRIKPVPHNRCARRVQAEAAAQEREQPGAALAYVDLRAGRGARMRFMSPARNAPQAAARRGAAASPRAAAAVCLWSARAGTPSAGGAVPASRQRLHPWQGLARGPTQRGSSPPWSPKLSPLQPRCSPCLAWCGRPRCSQSLAV